MGQHKTTFVARELGVPPDTLIATIRKGKMAPPSRDESGHYLWSAEDVARAKEALKNDRRKRTPQGVRHAAP